MLGGMPIEPGEEDSIDDAVGEMCNMLAAGWKNRVDSLSSKCFLSPPTVISGRNYKVHMANSSAKVMRAYQFAAHTLHITLYCVEQAAA
jgi:chemotaxis protein CheX